MGSQTLLAVDADDVRRVYSVVARRLEDGTLKFVSGIAGLRVRARSVLGAVLRRLNANQNFLLPLGVGVVVLGCYLGVRLASFKYLRAHTGSGVGGNILARGSQKRLKMKFVDGVMVTEPYDGLPRDATDGLFVNGELWSSADLVGELKLFTAYKERTYTLLQQVVSRCAQLIRQLPTEYGVPLNQRYRLLYGSVALAMEVDVQEQEGMLHMKLSDGYGASKGWKQGIPEPIRFADVLRGNLRFMDYMRKSLVSSFHGSRGGVGPATHT